MLDHQDIEDDTDAKSRKRGSHHDPVRERALIGQEKAQFALAVLSGRSTDELVEEFNLVPWVIRRNVTRVHRLVAQGKIDPESGKPTNPTSKESLYEGPCGRPPVRTGTVSVPTAERTQDVRNNYLRRMKRLEDLGYVKPENGFDPLSLAYEETRLVEDVRPERLRAIAPQLRDDYLTALDKAALVLGGRFSFTRGGECRLDGKPAAPKTIIIEVNNILRRHGFPDCVIRYPGVPM